MRLSVMEISHLRPASLDWYIRFPAPVYQQSERVKQCIVIEGGAERQRVRSSEGMGDRLVVPELEEATTIFISDGYTVRRHTSGAFWSVFLRTLRSHQLACMIY